MGTEQHESDGNKMGDVTFGPRPTYASDDDFELAVSSDGKAFTLTFSKLEAILDDDQPAVGRVFLLVLPVDSGGCGVDITLAAQGYAITTGGASGYAVMSINGQTSMKFFPSRIEDQKYSSSGEGRKCPPSGTEFLKQFPSGTEESFTQVLRLQAGPTRECHLAVFVLVERSGHPDAGAYLNIDAIDAEISPRKEG